MKGKMHGNTGNTLFDKMARLAQHHTDIAKSFLTVMEIMRNDGIAKKTSNGQGSAALMKAMQLDHTRRAMNETIEQSDGEPETRKVARKKAPGLDKAALEARRTKTMAFLKRFSKTEARNPKSDNPRGGVGTLLRHGYLKRQGDGFIRTDKAFSIEKR